MIDMTKISGMSTDWLQQAKDLAGMAQQKATATPTSTYTAPAQKTGGGITAKGDIGIPYEPPYEPADPAAGTVVANPIQEDKPTATQTATGGNQWANLNYLKDYYGGRWYDYGKKYFDLPGWYRAPRINPAGGAVIWHPKYGWQLEKAVEASGGDYSGFTPNFGDVYELFGGYNTASPLPGGAPAGTPGWEGYPGGGSGAGGSGYTPSGTPGAGIGGFDFSYPGPWNTAESVLTDFAQGMPTDVPPEWEDMIARLNEIYTSGGMPVSQEPAYTAAKEAAQYDVKQAIDQAMEGYGLQGLRQSTPAIAGAQRIAGEMAAKLGAGFASDELGALEAAKQRQMATLPYGYQAGAGIAGLEESAKDRALAATGQLYPLGTGMWQMPSTLAQQAYQMGSGIYGQGQQGLSNMMSEWLRTQAYNNPYLQYALGLGGGVGQYAPKTYTPGGLLGLGIC